MRSLEKKKDKKRKKEKSHKRKDKKKDKKKKKKKSKARSRSRSSEKRRRKRIRDYEKGEETKKRYEMIEQKKYDMDPSKSYNKDWNQAKVDPEDDEYNREEESDFVKPEQYTQIINGLEYKVYKDHKRTIKIAKNNTGIPVMIEVYANDRLGRKVRVKCCPDDTIGDLKKLISAHTGTRPEKIRLQRSLNVFKDHITLADYEIHHGSSVDMYYN